MLNENMLKWLFPFITTICGSCIAFILPDKMPFKIRRIFYGISGGFFVSMMLWIMMYWKFMVALRFRGETFFIPIVNCFLGGFLLLPILSSISRVYCKTYTGLRKPTKFMIAISFYFCVKGVVICMTPSYHFVDRMLFQNIVLGAITAIPLRLSGYSATKSLRLSLFAICAILVPLLMCFFWHDNESTLPFLAFFTGGIMCYLVIEMLFSKRIWTHYFSIQALFTTYLTGFLGMLLFKNQL